MNIDAKSLRKYYQTTEYYMAILIKSEIIPFAATCMELEAIIQREPTQKQKTKY